MALQSNFPKTRKYHLWAIFLSYLVSIDQASSEADRKLFGMLAYRMISKAAESVPSDSVCSFPFTTTLVGRSVRCESALTASIV